MSTDGDSAAPDHELVWRRVAELLPAWDGSSALFTIKTDPESIRMRRKLKRAVRVLDVVALLWWSWVVIKVFVADVDRWVAQELGGEWNAILGYRLAFFLLALALLAMVLRGYRLAGSLIYVAFFPVIVLTWKLPRLLFRLKSGTVAIGSYT